MCSAARGAEAAAPPLAAGGGGRVGNGTPMNSNTAIPRQVCQEPELVRAAPNTLIVHSRGFVYLFFLLLSLTAILILE